MILKLTLQSIWQTLFWTVVCGVLYPLFITVIAQLTFPHQANGSLIERDGKLIGSELLAQQFTDPKHFWSRPSAASYGTGPTGISGSSGSNHGPTSAQLQTDVSNNAKSLREAHKLPVNAPVPADLVYASASGLDPHISPEAAEFQVQRVAAARGMTAAAIEQYVHKYTEERQWGFLGEPRVNVLLLNLALDSAQKKTN